MGHRKLMRVPMDFNHPLNQTWPGYIHSDYPDNCSACDGSGLNPATRQLDVDFFDFAGTGRRWRDAITEDEVAALLEHNRLWDFTRNGIPNPTAAQVNAWENGPGFGHDGINRWILVKTRAKRLGVYGKCKKCKGEGVNYRDAEHKRQCDEWEPTDPPKGAGFQLWETVSEGSPISPVFASADELATWCESNATTFGSYKTSKAKWLQMFVQDSVDMGTMFMRDGAYLGPAIDRPEAAGVE